MHPALEQGVEPQREERGLRDDHRAEAELRKQRGLPAEAIKLEHAAIVGLVREGQPAKPPLLAALRLGRLRLRARARVRVRVRARARARVRVTAMVLLGALCRRVAHGRCAVAVRRVARGEGGVERQARAAEPHLVGEI